MALTQTQKAAAEARGNVLLMAGAGTGKTLTLVERVLHCMREEQPAVAIGQILMVTFTEAAAAEMRARVRKLLEAQASQPVNAAWWQEQLALFDVAPIGTLHSFCLRLLRQHFYELELDPEFVVLGEEESHLLAHETLEALLEGHYRGQGPLSGQVLQLIEFHGGSSDDRLKELVLRLHNYTQTLPNPERWFKDQSRILDSPEPAHWQEWLMRAFHDLRDEASAAFDPIEAGNLVAAGCMAVLRALPADCSREVASQAVAGVLKCRDDCQRGKKGIWVDPHKDLFDQCAFLNCLLKVENGMDPLREDWNWMRGSAGALLELAQQFTREFSLRKRELGGVDFHDLEQFALDLLIDRETGQPTEASREWRRRLRHVFVDEYQDINAAQDAIIRCLSRDGAQANRFLVGDVKQSIYRFRLADPYIFQEYAREWRRTGSVIALQENFRSHPQILEFANSLFRELMRGEMGGVVYDDEAVLKAAGPADPADPADPRVELHLRLAAGRGDPGPEEDGGQDLAELSELEKEARMVCERVRSLVSSGRSIYDPELKAARPIQWRDIALLYRSPAGNAEACAKEFARQGVPLEVARGGFYESREVLDILSLLMILDNPLQDIPLLAVLRSPMVAMDNEELAVIRPSAKGRYWRALQAFGGARPERDEHGELRDRVRQFLEVCKRWRLLAREVSLCRCLRIILAETHYDSWLETQPRADLRRANLQRVLALARKFDAFQRQGLFRFLTFVQAQQEAAVEPPAPVHTSRNAVRMMSIHQSKGLEFPVVVLANLAKQFNERDSRQGIILDEKFGICPKIQSPKTSRMYPSLSHWLARKRQSSEMRAEEMRLFYVGATRARELLILTGSISEKKRGELWAAGGSIALRTILRARSFADWLALWFSVTVAPHQPEAAGGQTGLLRWRIGGDLEASDDVQPATQVETASAAESMAALERIAERLQQPYRYAEATTTTAKTTVTTLRREFEREAAEESRPAFSESRWPAPRAQFPSGSASGGGASAADIGTAHHKFLQLASVDALGSEASLRTEAARLVNTGALTPGQAGLLDFPALGHFWLSETGAALRANPANLKRELAFTVRLGLDEIALVGGRPPQPLVDGDFIVVQGVVDLVARMPDGMWVLDFKTDAVSAEALPERARLYEPQLRAYAAALARIYKTTVTQGWLYFTQPREFVAVDLAPANRPPQAPSGN